MLVINEDLIVIDDAIDQLVNNLLERDEFLNYQEKLNALDQDSEVQVAIQELSQLTDSYTKEIDFVKFRPELRELRRTILANKKKLDMNSKVIELRYAEVACQEILAEISQQIANVVSPTIFVDEGLPLSSSKEHPEIGIYQNIKEKD